MAYSSTYPTCPSWADFAPETTGGEYIIKPFCCDFYGMWCVLSVCNRSSSCGVRERGENVGLAPRESLPSMKQSS